MAPFVPHTCAAAAIRLSQIALDNQSRMIRRLRAKLATKRRESAAIKKDWKIRLTEIGLCMSKKIERMRAKNQQARESNPECHHKLQTRIHQTEDTIQEQHLIIEAQMEENASLLQTIQGLQEDNVVPFDDECEEEPE
ncbi:hypothetical protein F511_06159 [Dorcoceras hygrometricum]|uniref:Uncharacterized protein n=1 Tax=Dorcoceras hygrometricum TaxID=472368 RepID=A0A2Z7CLY9_9LAMI|nr:hypothetical protein F511_06159 [Dorcoceras hygrometricum]